MEIYLVGGAVRDRLLDRPIKERDFVVVGGSPEEMLAQGYTQVGKSFPVFLHPQTKEEYALARTEKKVAPGYQGFEFDASEHVSLEDDLKRRDLTINAIAATAEGTLIDPYHGQQDIKNKILRHVSDAFVEDPVRLLRVARFAARFPHFSIAEETLALMQEMVIQKEVDALVPERVFKELEKALGEQQPLRFFEVLLATHAFSILFPYLEYHDLSENLKALTKVSNDPKIRFMALAKACDQHSFQTLANCYPIPSDFHELAKRIQQVDTPTLPFTKEDALWVLRSLDSLRRPDIFENWLIVQRALTEAISSHEILNLLEKALPLIQSIKIDKSALAGMSGPEIAKAIEGKQLDALSSLFPQ